MDSNRNWNISWSKLLVVLLVRPENAWNIFRFKRNRFPYSWLFFIPNNFWTPTEIETFDGASCLQIYLRRCKMREMYSDLPLFSKSDLFMQKSSRHQQKLKRLISKLFALLRARAENAWILFRNTPNRFAKADLFITSNFAASTEIDAFHIASC